MSQNEKRWDHAGWGSFGVIFVVTTGLLMVWMYLNRDRDLSESRATAYVVAAFLGALIAGVLTVLLNSVLQGLAARRAAAASEDGDPPQAP